MLEWNRANTNGSGAGCPIPGAVELLFDHRLATFRVRNPAPSTPAAIRPWIARSTLCGRIVVLGHVTDACVEAA